MKIGPINIPLPSLSALKHDVEKPVAAAEHQLVDKFETVAKPVIQAVTPFVTGRGDQAFDGDIVGAHGQTFSPSTPLANVPATTPKGGVRNSELLIEVNGVGANVATQKYDMQQLANESGSRVVGVHNGTNGEIADGAQELGDEVDAGRDNSATSLAHLVERQLKAKQPVHIVAHSQGGAVTARALTEVHQQLAQQLGSTAAADKAMSSVKVETFAGAAWNYPDGPQYRHYVNLADPVPQIFGQGVPLDLGLAHPGAGAQIISFSESTHPHSFETYLPRRQPW